MFDSKFRVSVYGTVLYTSGDVTYRVDWTYGLGQVWLDWPAAADPVREDALWQVMG